MRVHYSHAKMYARKNTLGPPYCCHTQKILNHSVANDRHQNRCEGLHPGYQRVTSPGLFSHKRINVCMQFIFIFQVSSCHTVAKIIYWEFTGTYSHIIMEAVRLMKIAFPMVCPSSRVSKIGLQMRSLWNRHFWSQR